MVDPYYHGVRRVNEPGLPPLANWQRQAKDGAPNPQFIRIRAQHSMNGAREERIWPPERRKLKPAGWVR